MSRGERIALIKQIADWMKEEAEASRKGGGGGQAPLGAGSSGHARFKKGRL